jgi:RNA polymerase sigma-70 factor, ECF subfamily
MGITDIAAEHSASRADHSEAGREALFERIATEFSAPMARLARAHEADASLQQDLLQEIHLAVWRSLPAHQGRCSLRTWVFRVAHNVAATHLLRRKRRRLESLTSLDELLLEAEGPEPATAIDEQRALEKLTGLIRRLKPIDRQVIVLHLEGLAADDIAEIAGLSISNVHTKLHRIRELLAKRIHSGDIE